MTGARLDNACGEAGPDYGHPQHYPAPIHQVHGAHLHRHTVKAVTEVLGDRSPAGQCCKREMISHKSQYSREQAAWAKTIHHKTTADPTLGGSWSRLPILQQDQLNPPTGLRDYRLTVAAIPLLLATEKVNETSKLRSPVHGARHYRTSPGTSSTQTQSHP